MKKQYTKPYTETVNVCIESVLLSTSNTSTTPYLHNEVGDDDEYTHKRAWGNSLWD